MVAVRRDGELIPFGDPRCDELEPGDRVIALHAHPS